MALTRDLSEDAVMMFSVAGRVECICKIECSCCISNHKLKVAMEDLLGVV